MNEENKNLEEILKKHEEKMREGIGEDVKKHIDIMLENVRSDFKVFGEQLVGVSEDISLLKEDMDYVKSEIVEIKYKFREVDEVLNKKVNKEIADEHEKRIIKLESAVLAQA